MKIINKTGQKKIDEAVELFWSYLPENLEQLNSIPSKDYFYQCDQTSDEIASKIKEFFYNTDSTKDITLVLYKPFNRWSSAIGYTDEPTRTIHINSRKLNSLEILDYSGHIFHESLHVMGYTHSFYNSKNRPFTVPYFLGYLMSGDKTIEELLDYKKPI